MLIYSINVLQGSAATRFSCDENVNDHFVANCLPSLSV